MYTRSLFRPVFNSPRIDCVMLKRNKKKNSPFLNSPSDEAGERGEKRGEVNYIPVYRNTYTVTSDAFSTSFSVLHKTFEKLS